MPMPMPIIDREGPRLFPPRVSAFTKPFWDGVAEGIFQTTRCSTCERLCFPPRPICPYCWTATVAWEALPTTGKLYSWTRVRIGPAVFDPQLPYEVGIVDLDVGLRIACGLVGGFIDWRCDMPMALVTLRYEDGPLFAAAPQG